MNFLAFAYWTFFVSNDFDDRRLAISEYPFNVLSEQLGGVKRMFYSYFQWIVVDWKYHRKPENAQN